MSAARALVFDFDGLLIDSERVIAEHYLEVAARHGAELGFADIAHFFGTVDAHAEWDALFAERCTTPLTMAELDAGAQSVLPPRIDELGLLPGVADLLHGATERGWSVGLATGGRRERIERRLALLGVRDRFHAVACRDEVERGKPAPDVYLEAARRLDVGPEACVALEDSVPGAEAALAAGMTVVLCPSIVTTGCTFPPGVARRVASLAEVGLDDLAALLGAGRA